MDKKDLDNYYMTADFDPYEKIEEGKVVVPLSKNVENFYTFWTDKDLKYIIKKGKAYLGPDAPVGMLKNLFGKKQIMEVVSLKFDSLEEMVNFMKDNNGLLVYKCIEVETQNFHAYILRYFARDSIAVRLNWFTYKFNKMLTSGWERS